MGEEGAEAGRAWLTWLTVGLLVLVLSVSFLYFLQTRDLTTLFLGATLAFYVVAGVWIYRDATGRSMPAWPWLLALLFTHALGLIAYLVVRELRPEPA